MTPIQTLERPPMKTWVKVLLGICTFFSFIALIVVAVFTMTSGLVDSADAFFAAVKQKDMATARTYLAEDFKKSTDEKALNQFLAGSTLLNFKESSWSNREINNGRGTLEGEIVTESGGVVPIKLSFVKENDEWKIYAIQKTVAGLQTDTANTEQPKPQATTVAEPSKPIETANPIEPQPTPTVSADSLPDATTQTAMVKQAMSDFLASVKVKDMTHFHSTLSQLWQDQYTVEKLNEAYKPITDNKADWSVLNSVTPSVSANKDNDGVLTLTGTYPTKPSRVDYEQSYIYENGAWKLISFSIEAKSDNSQ